MRLILIFILLFSSCFSFAQNTNQTYAPNGQLIELPVYNVKTWSKAETERLYKEVINLSPSYSPEIYEANLNAIRKINFITSGNISRSSWEKNKSQCEAALVQRELAYKKILPPEEYQKHINALKRKNANFVNTNITVTSVDYNSVSNNNISRSTN